MQEVPWKRAVVLMKKPQTSICQPLVWSPGAWTWRKPPRAQIASAKTIGTTASNRFRKTSSG